MTVMLTVFTYLSWIKRLFTCLAKKGRLLWTCTRFVFNRVETKGGSVLCFSQDKLTYIFRSRRKCNYTAVSWIINVSASLVSFFCKFRSAVQNRSSTEGEISTRLLKLHVPANIFSVLPHSRRLLFRRLAVFNTCNLIPTFKVWGKPLHNLKASYYEL